MSRLPHPLQNPQRHHRAASFAAATIILLLQASCGEEATLAPSQSFTMRSTHVGADYKIDVYLPQGYSADGAPLPALYQLDGDSQAGPTAAILAERAKEVVVIGVGYPKLNERLRDYTPTKRASGEPAEGGLPQFSRFLREELVPKLEQEYNLSTDRALMGHSLGGLAATMIALEQPQITFSRFAAISPSLWWDDNVAFAREAERAMLEPAPTGRLFIAYGELEPSDIALTSEAFAERIQARAYPALSVKLSELERAEHLETWSIGYPQALEWLYED